MAVLAGTNAYRALQLSQQACASAVLVLGMLTVTGVRAELAPTQIHQAVQALCGAPEQTQGQTQGQGQGGGQGGQAPRPADVVLRALGGGIELSESPLEAPPGVQAQRSRLMLPDGTRLRLDLHRRGDVLAQVIVEVTLRIAGGYRPWLWVVTDGACRTRVARRLEYDEAGSVGAVLVLGETLEQVRSRQLLDAPLTVGAPTTGVTVAMIDSGVNYTLAALKTGLARDTNGALIGFDYWDMDARPFDSHPSRSPFLPQRHGTRTASVMLADAPMAQVAPMRYPRPDMSRMAQLVADAHARGISIVNLSLGGDDESQWAHFEQAVRAHPQMLFVVSAGNNGRDLDAQPVYPAALALDNLITVGSADLQGLPARGSNWGRRTVHLLVPAENLVATGFSGYAVRVAGSSYAAARVSALAACFQAAHPQWRAAELKTAIFDLAVQPVHESMAYVKVGVLPEPTSIERGACAAEPDRVTSLGRLQVDAAAIYPATADAAPKRVVSGAATHDGDSASRVFGYELTPLTLVWIEDAGWPLDTLFKALAGAARIYRQCGVRFGDVSIQMLRVPRAMRYYDTTNAIVLMKVVEPTAPALWFMRDTLAEPAFDAQAIGRSNVVPGSGLMNTVWMTAQLEHPGVALAHELYHVLANSGAHAPDEANLMNLRTSPDGTHLLDGQCERLIQVGGAFDLLKRL